MSNDFKYAVTFALNRLVMLLGLIYLVLIPSGRVKQQLKPADVGFLVILLIANSDLIERITQLTINKDGVQLFTEVKKLNEKVDIQNNKIDDLTDKLDKEREADLQALKSVDLQLSETVPLENLTKDLTKHILQASPLVIECIYIKAKEVRRNAWKSKKQGLIERTIPIFKALVQSEYGKARH